MGNPFMVGLLVQCAQSGRSDVTPEGLLVTGIKLKAFVNWPRASSWRGRHRDIDFTRGFEGSGYYCFNRL